MRDLAHLRQARGQRQDGHAAGVMRERRVQQGLVEPAQVAHAVDEAEAALGVEVEQAVACRQPQVEQRDAVPGAAARRTRGGLRELVVQREGQAGCQRGHAESGARAQQGQRAAARAALQSAAAVEQRAQRRDRVGGRRGHVDEVVHPRAQSGKHGGGFGRHAGGQHRQRGPVALQALMELDGIGALVGREIDEHRHRPEQGDAFVDRLGVRRQDHHRAQRAERIGQPRDVAAVARSEQIGLAACLWNAVAWSVHGACLLRCMVRVIVLSGRSLEPACRPRHRGGRRATPRRRAVRRCRAGTAPGRCRARWA